MIYRNITAKIAREKEGLWSGYSPNQAMTKKVFCGFYKSNICAHLGELNSHTKTKKKKNNVSPVPNARTF